MRGREGRPLPCRLGGLLQKSGKHNSSANSMNNGSFRSGLCALAPLHITVLTCVKVLASQKLEKHTTNKCVHRCGALTAWTASLVALGSVNGAYDHDDEEKSKITNCMKIIAKGTTAVNHHNNHRNRQQHQQQATPTISKQAPWAH